MCACAVICEITQSFGRRYSLNIYVVNLVDRNIGYALDEAFPLLFLEILRNKMANMNLPHNTTAGPRQFIPLIRSVSFWSAFNVMNPSRNGLPIF